MLQKYGTVFVRDDEKYKKNCIEKYGFSNPKIYEAWINVNSLNDVVPLFKKEDFKGNEYEYKWKCKKCGTEFFAIYDDGGVKKLCPKCYNSSSKFEDEIVNFLISLNINFERHNRHIIYPLELDFTIPIFKLAIEFNGSYWHSIDKKLIDYHLDKILKCNEIGYRLIHIWEDEWINDKESIKQRLKDIFENKEVIDFSKPLDRSWYNNIMTDDYELIDEIAPELILRNGYNVANCGYLIYEKCNKYN